MSAILEATPLVQRHQEVLMNAYKAVPGYISRLLNLRGRVGLDMQVESKATQGGGDRGQETVVRSQNVHKRDAKTLSSTRRSWPRAQSVRMAPIEADLVIFIDSAAKPRNLRWFRRRGIRLHPRRSKVSQRDYDILDQK